MPTVRQKPNCKKKGRATMQKYKANYGKIYIYKKSKMQCKVSQVPRREKERINVRMQRVIESGNAKQ